MHTKIALFLITGVLLVTIFSIAPITQISSATTTIYVDDSGGVDYTSIQEAINNANESDTIYVYSGTYNENIVISTTLTLTGETSTTTIINGEVTGHVIEINANSVTISGFTIQNAIGSGYDGIRMTNVQQCQITSNIIKENDEGISLVSANGNTINGNTIEDNTANGIGLLNSQSNIIENNIIHRNQNGQGINGINLQATSTGNTITENTITGTINECFNYGINLQNGANNNIVTDNSIMNNYHGIHIASTGNTIYHNTFDNKQSNAEDTGSNTWYSTSLQEGNRWYDYTGEDIDNDGIGDTPYIIDGGNNQDPYPLVNQRPTAIISTLSPNQATQGTTINFKGQGIDDGSIIQYEWTSNLEDGVLSEASEFSSSSLKVGIHTIRFRVKDNDNEWSDSASQTLVITQPSGESPDNQIPLATILSIAPNPATLGQLVSFNGRGIDNDEGGYITEYLWWEGDTTLSTAPSFQKTDLGIGTHLIHFKVRDNKYAWSDEVTQSITVLQGSSSGEQTLTSNPGGPYLGIENTSLRFDGSLSYDSNGIITNYTWDFGDGNIGYEEFVEYTYESGGNYTVTLTVRDNSGNTHSKTTYASIESITQDGDTGETPGFELILLIISALIAIMLNRRKQ